MFLDLFAFEGPEMSESVLDTVEPASSGFEARGNIA
jgi:hypothetical protein